METKKVKTVAEMAEEYGVSEEVFSNQIRISRLLIHYDVPKFDGKNIYPSQQDRLYKKLGFPMIPEESNNPEVAVIEEGIKININISKKGIQDMLIDLVATFAKNYQQSIKLPDINNEK